MLTIYQILNHLLVSTEENITIDSTQKGAYILTEDPGFEHERPSVAILQTCKRINEEGTAILYGRNNFTICLRMSSLLMFTNCILRYKLLKYNEHCWLQVNHCDYEGLKLISGSS